MRSVTRWNGWNTAEPIAKTARVPTNAIGSSGTCGLDGDVGAAFFEGLQYAVVGTAAFGENQHGNAAFADHLRGEVHGLDGGARIFAGDGNVAGLLQVRSEEGDLKQAFFREETEIRGDAAEHHGRIHIAQVIRAEDVAAAGRRFSPGLRR